MARFSRSIFGSLGPVDGPPLADCRSSFDFTSLMTDVSKLVTQALAGASLSAKGLSARMKISGTSLRKYGYGTRTPPARILTQLARLLRQHARHLQRVSRALDQVARKRSKALESQRRPGGPRRRRKANR
jgi:ribosome-binding protein aMBF1 (putative translation factor)